LYLVTPSTFLRFVVLSSREGEEQKAQGRGDSKVKWVEYERKVKSVNAKKAEVEADEKTNDPASNSEAARWLLKEKRRREGGRERL
jgi:hypothetical protein